MLPTRVILLTILFAFYINGNIVMAILYRSVPSYNSSPRLPFKKISDFVNDLKPQQQTPPFIGNNKLPDEDVNKLFRISENNVESLSDLTDLIDSVDKLAYAEKPRRLTRLARLEKPLSIFNTEEIIKERSSKKLPKMIDSNFIVLRPDYIFQNFVELVKNILEKRGKKEIIRNSGNKLKFFIY